MQEFYTYISQCPRFHETCEGGREENKEKKGSEDTRDLISYSSVFASSVSGRFHRSELLICSLHSICSTCHCYRIICRVLHALEEVILIQYPYFLPFGRQHIW